MLWSVHWHLQNGVNSNQNDVRFYLQENGAYMIISSIIPLLSKGYSHLCTRIECRQGRFHVVPTRNFDIMHCMTSVSFRLNYLPDRRIRGHCDETCISGLSTPFRKDNSVLQNHLKEWLVRNLRCQDSFFRFLCPTISRRCGFLEYGSADNSSF